MEIFVTSDLHLSHRRIAEEFKAEDGSPLRPFKNMEEHDQALINRINSIVGKRDKLFILGDITRKKRINEIVSALAHGISSV